MNTSVCPNCRRPVISWSAWNNLTAAERARARLAGMVRARRSGRCAPCDRDLDAGSRELAAVHIWEPPGPWTKRAACVGNPEPFHDVVEISAARRSCAQCPVRAECLNYALANERPGRRHGVWGGLTASQREKMARGVLQPAP